MLVGLQLIPAGLLATWPKPVSLTVRVRVIWAKAAVTPCAADIVTVQPPVPLHPPPDQPAKTEPAAACWVRVTTVPCWKFAAHTAPQVIPEGLLVTVPDPAPDFDTVNAKLGITSNCAVTLRTALIVTTHCAVPLQPPPDHPVKLDPAPAVAVRVTWVPCWKLAEQVAPQLIPEGLLETLPALRNPTISHLSQEGWVAVETIIDEHIVREMIPALKIAGAEGIIEYPLNKVVY